MIAALISETRMISPSELYRLREALLVNATHLAEAYMLSAPPQVVVIDKDSKLPEGCFPIVFVGEGGKPGTLGEHWFDGRRGVPAARVFVENTTALNSGPYSVSEVASHELLEAVTNERLAIWIEHPRRPGVQIAYECADPTQDHYPVRVHGTDWLVSNFVTPFWYQSRWVGAHDDVAVLERDFGYGLDWCKRLKQPGEISGEGYAVFRDKSHPERRWSEDIGGPLSQNSRKMDRKQHHSSRTQRLLAGA